MSPPMRPLSPPDASAWLTAGFALFAPALTALFVAGVVWAERRLGAPPAQMRRRAATVAGVAAAWLAVTWGLAASGVLARFDVRPPPLLLFLGAVLGLAAGVAGSRVGARLVEGIPLAALVGAQGFRLPLELLMHRAADEGVMPVQMSYSGRNLDILTGAAALVVAAAVARGVAPRWLVPVWNVVGAALLANILAVAIVSTPVFAWFGPDRLNTWIAFPPFVWLPGVMVLAAALGHLLVWRKLRTRAAAGRPEAQHGGGRSAAADAPGPTWLDRAAYPFRHRYADLPAGRIHYVDEGAGNPVLFVHGTPTWSFEFRHLVRALAPRHRCVAPDLLGFGLSGRPPAFAYTPEAHARVLAEFVEGLRLDRVTLVVHDFGGPIGLPLCLDHPERVARLVLLNTWMWPFDDDPDVERKARLAGGRLGRFLYQYANASLRLITPMAYGDRTKLTPAVHRQYLEPFRRRRDRVLVLHTLARAILGSRDFYAGLWRRAERLKGRPALIVWGMKDPAFGPRHLARWESLLPEARVVRLAGTGHWPHEEEPARVVEALETFLGH